MFDFIQRNTAVRNSLVVVLVFSLFAFVPPSETEAAPVVAVVAVIAAAAAAVVIYDYNSCGLNWIWGCSRNSSSSSNSLNNSNNQNTAPINTQNNQQNNAGNTTQRCNNSTPNDCGMTEVRYAFPGQACDISPIPNNRCPVPKIGEEGFYANPSRVRSGNTTMLYWDVEDATVCALAGGGLSLSSLGLTDTQETNTISAATTFTLTCSNGNVPDSPTASQQATVTIVPSFEEI